MKGKNIQVHSCLSRSKLSALDSWFENERERAGTKESHQKIARYLNQRQFHEARREDFFALPLHNAQHERQVQVIHFFGSQ